MVLTSSAFWFALGSIMRARRAVLDARHLHSSTLQAAHCLHRSGTGVGATVSTRAAIANYRLREATIVDCLSDALSRTGGGDAAATAGGGGKAESNATSDFQRGADRLLLDHRIVGPRVVAITWSSDSLAEVKLNNFPMDKMPPVVRNLFKSRINEALAALAEKSSLDDAINIALVDSESGLTMDKLDGVELVGAFDQPEDLP